VLVVIAARRYRILTAFRERVIHVDVHPPGSTLEITCEAMRQRWGAMPPAAAPRRLCRSTFAP
jgi:hypothetical protein